MNYAWPTAEIAVMGAEGAVNIVFRNELKAAADTDSERVKLTKDYEDKFNNPYIAAELGYIDEVIEPSLTRKRICESLDMLQNKRDRNPQKKHGNIPL